MEKERPLHVGGSGELRERSLAPARVGLLADVELSGAREGVLIVVLQRGRRRAVAPGGEAVALLRGVDHLAPGDGGRRKSAEQGEKRERSGHRSSTWRRATGRPGGPPHFLGVTPDGTGVTFAGMRLRRSRAAAGG